MEIVPLWTKRVDLNSRALDPLGLSRISDFLVEELLPGLTVMTSLGRNYIFYCWAIQQANQEKPQSYAQYIKILERLEAAYVVSGLLDQRENFPNAKGPIGRNRGLTAIWTAQNDEIVINFSVLKHAGGGYKQYYGNPMFNLGLIVPLKKNEDLFPEGRVLAGCYAKNIQGTQYFQKYLFSEVIPIDVLKEYGKSAGYLRLKEHSNEKNKLSAILFNNNQNRSINPHSRKVTFHMILELFKIYSKFQFELDDTEFRNITYYQQSIKDGHLIEYHPPLAPMKKTLLQWRFFQFHEHFTWAIESIFFSFLNSLEDSTTGLTLNEFLNENSNFTHEVDSFLGCDTTNLTLNEIFKKILRIKGIDGLIGKITSELFDSKVSIDDDLSEHSIRSELTSALEQSHTPRIVGLSFCLLFITITRYWQYLDSFNQDNLEIMNKEESEWGSLRTYVKRIQPDLSKMTLNDLFKITMEDIIDIHDKIAWQKMRGGNDTFRFQRNAGVFTFKMGYRPENRANRFYSIRSIFEDIGLVEKDENRLCISEYGVQFLEAIHYE